MNPVTARLETRGLSRLQTAFPKGCQTSRFAPGQHAALRFRSRFTLPAMEGLAYSLRLKPNAITDHAAGKSCRQIDNVWAPDSMDG